jgi:hypothetical protein
LRSQSGCGEISIQGIQEIALQQQKLKKLIRWYFYKPTKCLLEVMMINPKIRDGNLPTGKGTFVWLLPRLVDLFGSVGAMVEKLVEDDYQWVCVKAQHGYVLGCSPSYDPAAQIEILDEFVPAAEEAGIEMHGWGYNFGNTTAFRRWNDQQGKEIARIVEALVRWRFRSWTVNAEHDFKASGGRTAATTLINSLRESLAAHLEEIDVPIGLSSYKFISSHPDFPFSAFLQSCDFSGPQVYWQLSRFPVDQLEKSVGEWTAVADLPVVPAGTLYPEGSWWPTGEQVTQFNEAAKAMENVIGTNYWEYYYPVRYNKDDLTTALASFDWPSIPMDDDPPPDPGNGQPPDPGDVDLENLRLLVSQAKEQLQQAKAALQQAEETLQQAEDLLPD